MDNISNNPRPWGAGNHLSQTDMDELELRKVKALERIADALDGGKTSSASGIVGGEKKSTATSKLFSGSLFDCFKLY